MVRKMRRTLGQSLAQHAGDRRVFWLGRSCCTARAWSSFLPLLQEVSAICKTRDQLADKAVPRTTPCVLGLYALVTLLAARWRVQHALTIRPDAWYAKKNVPFSDRLAMVRRWLWTAQYFQMAQTKADMIKVPRALFEQLTETLCYAA